MNAKQKATEAAQKASQEVQKRERERLAFVENRDGKEAMLAWAEQTLAIYVDDSIKQGRYEDSIKVYVKTLKDNGRNVSLVSIDGQQTPFQQVVSGLKDAIAWHRGEKNLRVTEVEIDPDTPGDE